MLRCATVRIVSLCPSLTELVFDLGRGNDLVAVTDYCVHPAAGVERLERVGGTKTPRVDRIVEIRPDLVLLNEEENRREDAERLLASGLTCHSSLPKTIPETAEMVLSIGRAIGRTATAEKLAGRIMVRADAALRRARRRPAVAFAYLIWRNPWMTVNADTYPHALLATAGGRNVFADATERYPVITLEDVERFRPEVVLLGSEPFPFEASHVAELSRATGWTAERFRLVDGEYLSWHGSRTPAGIDYADALFDELTRG